MAFVESLLAYLIGLAAGLRADAIGESRRRRLEEALEREKRGRFAIRGLKSLREQMERIPSRIGAVLQDLPLADGARRPLEQLLNDHLFRADFADWLALRELSFSDEARGRMEQQMRDRGLPNEFVERFFDLGENMVFADPVLTAWRHQLGIAAIREEHAEILRRLREKDEEFSEKRLSEALDRYREIALRNHDIIDLHGMPEDERGLAMKDFVLRQLYIPLRVKAEPRGASLGPERLLAAEEGSGEGPPDEGFLKDLEEERERRRLAAAGRGGADSSAKETAEKDSRLPVGELLQNDRRLVVLADPGGGKTTLLRWFATAYLLRLKRDKDLSELPDAATLPDADWTPILIRCRELPREPHNCAVDHLLLSHFDMLDVEQRDRAPLKAAFRRKLEEGTALLMIDGLDEIQDPRLRARFSRRLETIGALFDRAPMLVASRIVGYREMPFRLGRGFRHATIADLLPEEMDAFAGRWTAATERTDAQREKMRLDLIRNIHSTDRVERLAGNPMLLTTLALVHRKIGRLPQKRHELYREALQVLLNWRGDIDEPLDWSEAVPQLEYAAYAMCRDGVQRLTRDRALELLEEMRAAYGGRLRDATRRPPEEFLDLLERRSSLLIQSGHERVGSRDVPVYEFRHLTFQEYLAALALLEPCYPGHRRGARLAESVAPLAGVVETRRRKYGAPESVVTENWREPLRLCLASCRVDDADDALLAVLRPAQGEDPARTARPRAIMAVLCLADEPSVESETVREVLAAFARQVGEDDGRGSVSTALDAAAMETARSRWAPELSAALARESASRSNWERGHPGWLCGMVGAALFPADEDEKRERMSDLAGRIAGGDDARSIEAALIVMQIAFEERAVLVPGLASALLRMLDRSAPCAHAAAWALGWLSGAWSDEPGIWRPAAEEVDILIRACADPHAEKPTVFWTTRVLGMSGDARAVEPLIERLKDEDANVRPAAVAALGRLGDARAVEPLIERLKDEDTNVRCPAVEALARIRQLNAVRRRLLSRDLDGLGPWLDPQDPIGEGRVAEAARELKKPADEIRALYEELAPLFGLRLEWK